MADTTHPQIGDVLVPTEIPAISIPEHLSFKPFLGLAKALDSLRRGEAVTIHWRRS